jgi:hypothetical protein
MKRGRKAVVHTLPDGFKVTVNEIKEVTGLKTNGAVRYRLRKAQTKEEIFKKAGTQSGRRVYAKLKTYILSNGDEINYKDLMVKCRLNEAAARSRLNKYDDPVRVYAPKGKTDFNGEERAKLAVEALESNKQKTRVVWGVPFVDWVEGDKLAPSDMDIARNEWLLSIDQYGFMNNGDD